MGKHAVPKSTLFSLVQKAADRAYAIYERNKGFSGVGEAAYAEYVVYERISDALNGRPSALREAAGLPSHPQDDEPKIPPQHQQRLLRLQKELQDAAFQIERLASMVPLDRRQEQYDAMQYARGLRRFFPR